MVNTWLTSDFHFGHENIIKYAKRPFKSLKHMGIELIRRFNQRVKPDDIVYFLGDLCFRNSDGGKKGEGTVNKADYYLKQLNGNFIFIKGNHDVNNGLKTCMLNCVIKLGGNELFLVHDPAYGNKDYKINICGHVHTAWKFKRKGKIDFINVGVDVWGYKPVSINEIMEEYKKWISGKRN